MTESDLPFAVCKQGIILKSFGLFSRFWYALLEINEHSVPLSIKVRYFCFPILNTQELGFPAKLILKTGFLYSLFSLHRLPREESLLVFLISGSFYSTINGFPFLLFVDLLRQCRRKWPIEWQFQHSAFLTQSGRTWLHDFWPVSQVMRTCLSDAWPWFKSKLTSVLTLLSKGGYTRNN